jgi:hypothetical protein
LSNCPCRPRRLGARRVAAAARCALGIVSPAAGFNDHRIDRLAVARGATFGMGNAAACRPRLGARDSIRGERDTANRRAGSRARAGDCGAES